MNGDFMDGLLLINKEKDYTSRDVVNILCKIFDTPKVGHTGTLDPLATGVMVIALGNTLKLVDILSSDIKEYIATVKLGISTDSLDVLGNVLDENYDYSIDKDRLDEVLKSFLGKSTQEVPKYSAVKVNGRRLYDYARKGISVELPKREIEVFDIELLDLTRDEFKFRVLVSKGTYIRSLIRDIGIKLGINTCMKELIRSKQGDFSIENSYTIEEVGKGNYEIINPVDYLKDYEIVKVDDYIAKKVLNGRILENRYKSEKIVFVDKDKKILGLYEPYSKDKTKVKPTKILVSIEDLDK